MTQLDRSAKDVGRVSSKPDELWRVPVTALILVALTGCGDTKDSATSTSIEPRLSVIETRIFHPSCTFSSCHGSDSPKEGLNLASGTYAALVGQPSTEITSRILVVPGDPAQSYLLEKLTSDAPSSGSRMPYTASPLSADKITAIRSWIEQGANND
ncbi:MAG TPA: c-type cytochrome domain-containing protein [Polyangiaceae bacterium]